MQWRLFGGENQWWKVWWVEILNLRHGAGFPRNLYWFRHRSHSWHLGNRPFWLLSVYFLSWFILSRPCHQPGRFLTNLPIKKDRRYNWKYATDACTRRSKEAIEIEEEKIINESEEKENKKEESTTQHSLLPSFLPFFLPSCCIQIWLSSNC